MLPDVADSEKSMPRISKTALKYFSAAVMNCPPGKYA
jgi:hypothetical protein